MLLLERSSECLAGECAAQIVCGAGERRCGAISRERVGRGPLQIDFEGRQLVTSWRQVMIFVLSKYIVIFLNVRFNW